MVNRVSTSSPYPVHHTSSSRSAISLMVNVLLPAGREETTHARRRQHTFVSIRNAAHADPFTQIETDLVQIISSTTLSPPTKASITFSPHTRPSSPTSTPSSPSQSASPILPPPRQPIPPSTPSFTSKTYKEGPTYLLNLTFSTTSNNGKSLLHKARIASGRYVGEFVDEEGGVEEGEVARWVGGLLSDAGLVGAEDEGLKNE